MDQTEERRLEEFVRKEVPPADAEPRKDLWPAMQRRMDQRERAGVPWFDWALLAAVAASLALVPRIIPMLLYHL